MECCTNTLALGCFDKCAVVELTDFAYTQAGVHTHEYGLSFFRNKQSFDVEIGDKVQIDCTLLNESAEHILRIKQPDGTYFTFVKDAVEYDCISFKTIL